MKTYQVYEGGTDKHDNQYYNLIATYLDKDKALAHGKQIAESNKYPGDELEYGEYEYGKCLSWSVYDGFGAPVFLAEVREINIIE